MGDVQRLPGATGRGLRWGGQRLRRPHRIEQVLQLKFCQTTGQPGVCAQGEEVCRQGQVACAPRAAAAAEICDGLDRLRRPQRRGGACMNP
ncbi:MAG: hypothetical protein R3F43_28165 [bacterium]